MFTRDITRSLKPNLSKKKELLVGKILIVVIIFVCIVFAALQLGLIAILSAMASGGLLVVAPALVGVFFWRKGTAKGAIVSMAGGGLLTGGLYVLSFVLYDGVEWWPSVIGFSVTLFLFLVVSLLTTPPDKAEVFMSEVKEEMDKQGF